MRLGAAVLLVSLLTVACAVPFVQTPETRIDAHPQTFVLTLDDLPPQFAESSDSTRSGPTTNEDIAGKRKEPQAVLMKLNDWGRIQGYEALYEASGFDMLAGTAFVHSWASVFETTEGADAYFEALDTPAMATRAERTLNPVSLPQVADRTKGYTFVQPIHVNDGQMVWKFYRVTFRKHNVVAGVITASLAEGATVDDAVELARTMEARIE